MQPEEPLNRSDWCWLAGVALFTGLLTVPVIKLVIAGIAWVANG